MLPVHFSPNVDLSCGHCFSIIGQIFPAEVQLRTTEVLIVTRSTAFLFDANSYNGIQFSQFTIICRIGLVHEANGY